jgi:paraquat-inducible protein B
MPRLVSPLQVGSFVLAALVLALGLLLFFSSTTLFSHTQRYILYFEDSVKGLSVGSSVKLKGVPIGQVKKIYISHNQSPLSARIPVLIEVEADQLRQLADLQAVPVSRVIEKEIERGLRGQLELESFITGILFIELNYFPSAGEPVYIQQSPIYREIPTVRGAFSDLGNSANDLMARLASIDYESLTQEITQLAATVNHSLSQVAFDKLSEAVTGSLTSLQGILSQAEGQKLGESLSTLTRNLSRATADDGELTLMLKNLNASAANFNALSGELAAAAQGDNALGVKIHRLVNNLAEASDSLSRLADYLERNPNALLTGKKSNE